ncbi:kinesin-like protein KIF20B isoform X2 [Prorops nasuta]
MQKLLQAESPSNAFENMDSYHSVWVSFAEIYNETIYDLLSNECPKKRRPLKVATDSRGRTYIKDLKSISVNSGVEAYQVLMAGQYNLKVAATALNARSSRSHCIFTIKLLKYKSEDNPAAVDISTFAFCDLAGSERLKKTLNIGDRLKEAQNINTSLLVLGRCLKSIYDGQAQKQNEHTGPFRESKLTRLFQWALCGKEKISLIVNVNPIASLSVETQNVLCFSAIAKKIVLQPKEEKYKQHKSKSRFSLIASKESNMPSEWNMAELDSIREETVDDDIQESAQETDDVYEELLSENKKLKDELLELKNSMILRDLEIRKEMADSYTAMMEKLENDVKNRIRDVEKQKDDAIEWSVKQVEDYYKQKLNQTSCCKKRRLDELSYDIEVDHKILIEELKSENEDLNSRLTSLKQRVLKLKDVKNSLNAEKNKLLFELSVKAEELTRTQTLLSVFENNVSKDDGYKAYIDELKKELFSKREHVHKLKEFLNEAKEEYIAITKDMQEKDQELQEQERLMAENEERIEDLESQLEHANICLEDKTKTIDLLEDKIEQQQKVILVKEETIQVLRNKVKELENEKRVVIVEDQSPLEKFKLIKQKECEKLHENLQELSYGITKDIKAIQISDDSMDNQIEKVIRSLEYEKLQLIEKTKVLEGSHSKQSQQIQDLLKEKELYSNIIEIKNNEIEQMQKEINDFAYGKNENVNKNEGNQLMESIDPFLEETSNFSSNLNTLIDENEVLSEKMLSLNLKKEIKLENEDNLLNDEFKSTERYYKKQISTLEKNNSDLQTQLNVYEEKNKFLQDQLITAQINLDVATDQVNSFTKETNKAPIILTDRDCQTCEKLQQNISLSVDPMLTSVSRSDISSQTVERDSRDINIQTSFVCNTEDESVPTDSSIEGKDKQCLQEYLDRVHDLEKELYSFKDIQHQYETLNEKLKEQQHHFDLLMERKNLELQNYQDQLNREKSDKEEEIRNLQKEIKKLIGNEDNSKSLEISLKSTLKELTKTKEMLSLKDEKIETLQMHLKTYEQNTRIGEILERTSKEQQLENERLRILMENLKKSISEKELEMESFMKNRDATVNKYESLVKALQEDLDREKREVTRYQELFHRQNPGSQTKVTESEEKVKKSLRARQQTNLLQAPEASTEKRVLRKKKLFVALDDSVQDIEQQEVVTIPSTPSPQSVKSTRSLRSRRKK